MEEGFLEAQAEFERAAPEAAVPWRTGRRSGGQDLSLETETSGKKEHLMLCLTAKNLATGCSPTN